MFLVGIVISVNPIEGIIVLALFGLFLILKSRGITKKSWVVFALVLILGWLRMDQVQSNLSGVLKSLRPVDNTAVNVVGKVNSFSKTRWGKFRYAIQATIIKPIDQTLHNSLILYLYSRDSLKVESGDSLKLQSVEFSLMSGPRNPGDFDFQRYYLRHGIFGRLSISDTTEIAIIAGKVNPVEKSIHAAQTWIRRRLNLQLDPASSGLLTALILGDKSDLDPDLIKNFQTIGVVHVLAVSGLHVGYILIILMLVVRILRIPWGWDRIAVIGGLAFYVALTGFRLSVIRAAGMGSLYILAPVLNRRASPYNIIGAVALIMMIFQPLSVMEAGFQLSFMAVLSIIGFLDIVEPYFPERLRIRSVKNPVAKFFYSIALVSLAAQLGTLPVTATLFHTIPLVGILANALIVPVIGIVVSLGFILLVTASIPWIGYCIAQTIWLLQTVITKIATTLSQISLAAVTIHGTVIPMLLILFGCVLIILFLLNKTQFRRALFGAGILLSFFIWIWATQKQETKLLFLDVGQGDSIILQMADGHTMLVDGGPRTYWEDAGKEVVIPVAQRIGISRFTYMVLTHSHSDHLGGLISVIRSMPVDTFITSTTQTHSHLEATMFRALDSAGVYIDTLRFGTRIHGKEGTTIDFLWPPTGKTYSNLNNQSEVLLVSKDKESVLLTGDLEAPAEKEMMAYWELPTVNILKCGHHGSITSTSIALLEAIQPKTAVIFVGAKNKFGHPSILVLNRLKNRRIGIHRTDKSGAYWVTMKRDTMVEKLWK